MRLEPAARANAKDLVPEIHWNDASQMACDDLLDKPRQSAGFGAIGRG